MRRTVPDRVPLAPTGHDRTRHAHTGHDRTTRTSSTLDRTRPARTDAAPSAVLTAAVLALLATIATLALSLSTAAAQALPTSYELPGEAVFPEGIALGEDEDAFYVGATNGGTIFRADIASGEVEIFASGEQPTAIGMEVDAYGRLWVAGGQTGSVFVYDTANGELLRSYATPDADATFLNDLTFVDDAVYVTDSMRPQLFRIEAGETLGELESFVSFEGTPFAYQEGFNANGIVTSPDERSVLIVQSNTGLLFRVELATAEVTQAEAPDLSAGDGMFRDGDVLYVVRNQIGQVERLRLSPSGDTALVDPDGPVTSPAFEFPTTAIVRGESLFAVNSQFDQQGGQPDLPFEVVRVPLF